MKFGMCNEFCEGWDFERVCSLAASAGYQGVEIAPFTLADSVKDINWQERQGIRQTAEDNGLEVIGLHWLLVKPEGLHLNSPDRAVRKRTVDYLMAEIDFCSDIGGGVMIVGSPKQRNVLPGQSYPEVWQRSVEVFAELAEHGAERDVCLCIEPLGANETNFVHTAEQARRLVNAVGHPNFQMMLDVKAMCQDEEPIPDIIRDSGPWLRHFHANDENLLGPGFGDTDFGPIAEALREVNYDGYVSVEVFDFSPGPEKIANKSIEHLRKVFGSPH
ncbi:MAG: sugar phosphate isomerase/epimerase family protein [Candidatus Brocadiia bacterium]